MSMVFGWVVFALLYGGILWATSRRWRYLARSYASDAGPALNKRTMRSAVLIGLGGIQSIKGIMTIAVHRNGVSFRMMRIFSLFHDPFFVPYSDISGWKTTWYLDARSSELQFRRAPDVKVVLPEEEAVWIRAYANGQMMLRDVNPPHGNAGRGWYAFSVGHAVLSLVMIFGISAYLLLK